VYEEYSQEFGGETPWKLTKKMDFMETDYVGGTWMEMTQVLCSGKLWC
jgi:hypothetical protein